MRHSKIDLTMNTYTDPRLLDVQGAVESFPSFPLAGGSGQERIAAKATGTDDWTPSPLAPTLALTTGKTSISGSIPVNTDGKPDAGPDAWRIAVSAYSVNEKSPLTTAVNGLQDVGVTGLEPVTSSLSSWHSNQLN